ncbi:hypothetical protein E2320_010104 [Naja naja]|nr:hypothetical protein E2320_010104 [Naja naja]
MFQAQTQPFCGRFPDSVCFAEGNPVFVLSNHLLPQQFRRSEKEYSSAIMKADHDFRHRVEMALPYSTSWCLLYTDCFTTVTCRFRVCIKEPKSIFDPQHLLTCTIDGKEINNVENCIERLKMMDAQSQVWGQDMLLQIKENKLLLTDIEAEEELDCYPLEDIQDWVSILNRCIYHSILAISVKDLNEQKTSILLFQCEQIGADLLKTKIQKAIEEWRTEHQTHDMFRVNLENMLNQKNRASYIGNSKLIPHDSSWDMESRYMEFNEAEQQSDRQQKYETHQEDPKLSSMSQDKYMEIEILNHVLDDIESFARKVQKNGTLSDKKKKKKKKGKESDNNQASPSEFEFRDCFQKVKYSFNLLGNLDQTIQQPSAPELINLIFSTLRTILTRCPMMNLASTIVLPFLTPAAINLLMRSLNSDEQIIWKKLGTAWNQTSYLLTYREEFPNGQTFPPYIPIFSDGWIPPKSTWRSNNMAQVSHS